MIQMLSHGMIPFRMGGLVQNTLWTVVTASCPSVGSGTTPAGQAAHRVTLDINRIPVCASTCLSCFLISTPCRFYPVSKCLTVQLMSSNPNMKVRAFIAASLNHKFLEDWLREFFRYFSNVTSLVLYHHEFPA